MRPSGSHRRRKCNSIEISYLFRFKAKVGMAGPDGSVSMRAFGELSQPIDEQRLAALLKCGETQVRAQFAARARTQEARNRCGAVVDTGGGRGRMEWFPPAAGDKRTDSQGRLRHADRSDFRERQLQGAEVGCVVRCAVHAGGRRGCGPAVADREHVRHRAGGRQPGSGDRAAQSAGRDRRGRYQESNRHRHPDVDPAAGRHHQLSRGPREERRVGRKPGRILGHRRNWTDCHCRGWDGGDHVQCRGQRRLRPDREGVPEHRERHRRGGRRARHHEHKYFQRK